MPGSAESVSFGGVGTLGANDGLLYAIAEAPIAWAGVLFLLPHLLAGAYVLWATARKKVLLRQLNGTLAMALQLVFGVLFFGVAFGALVNGTRNTYACRDLAASPELKTVSGPVVIEDRFYKPGKAKLTFSVGGETFTTATMGLDTDCGTLVPLGKLVTLKEGQPVTITHVGDVIVSLRRVQAPTP